MRVGYNTNVDESNWFGYVIPSIGFDYKIDSGGQLVFATNLKAHINLGDNFEFYQAAVLGASTGLRGYREQRFSGESALALSADLRLKLLKFNTGFS